MLFSVSIMSKNSWWSSWHLLLRITNSWNIFLFYLVFFSPRGHLWPKHDMNQALLMTVLMGLTFADEVLQSANEMHSTSQTTQLRALLAWRERGKSAS